MLQVSSFKSCYKCCSFKSCIKYRVTSTSCEVSKMPLKGKDGQCCKWCCVCKDEFPVTKHKTLRVHLNREHDMELLAGCSKCFYYRKRWNDVFKHCHDVHRFNINKDVPDRVVWGLTELRQTSYSKVREEFLVPYPLEAESLSKTQAAVIQQARVGDK